MTNYDKAILDALTGLAYEDDSQIYGCVSFKEIEKGKAGTKITIYDGVKEHYDEIIGSINCRLIGMFVDDNTDV